MITASVMKELSKWFNVKISKTYFVVKYKKFPSGIAYCVRSVNVCAFFNFCTDSCLICVTTNIFYGCLLDFVKTELLASLVIFLSTILRLVVLNNLFYEIFLFSEIYIYNVFRMIIFFAIIGKPMINQMNFVQSSFGFFFM